MTATARSTTNDTEKLSTWDDRNGRLRLERMSIVGSSYSNRRANKKKSPRHGPEECAEGDAVLGDPIMARQPVAQYTHAYIEHDLPTVNHRPAGS
jgi:hypothetical protein